MLICYVRTQLRHNSPTIWVSLLGASLGILLACTSKTKLSQPPTLKTQDSFRLSKMVQDPKELWFIWALVTTYYSVHIKSRCLIWIFTI